MSTRVAVVVVTCALAWFGPGASRAVPLGVYDGFEDGNTTVNLAWFDINPGHGTDGGVVADPIRSGNLVWKAMGDEAAARYIATTNFAPIAWQGFHASVEYLTTTSSRFAGTIMVGDHWMPFDTTYKAFAVSVRHDIAWGNMVNLQMMDANRNGPVIGYDKWFDLSLVPVNQWLRLDLWHDPATGLVRGALRNSEGQVIVENSLTPVSVGDDTSLGQIVIGPQEFEWQYMDNATLTPEPATFAVLILGGLGAMRRRR